MSSFDYRVNVLIHEPADILEYKKYLCSPNCFLLKSCSCVSSRRSGKAIYGASPMDLSCREKKIYLAQADTHEVAIDRGTQLRAGEVFSSRASARTKSAAACLSPRRAVRVCVSTAPPLRFRDARSPPASGACARPAAAG